MGKNPVDFQKAKKKTDSLSKGYQHYVLDASYCDDFILVTKNNEVWTYSVVEGAPMGVNRMEELSDHVAQTTKILESQRDRECHIYLATRAFDAESWLTHMRQNHAQEVRATGIAPAPAFDRILVDMARAMVRRGFKQFTRYYGVKLGVRGGIMSKVLGEEESTFKETTQAFMHKFSGKKKVLDPVPTAEELRYWHGKAEAVRTRLFSSEQMKIRPATAQDMWEWIWHMQTLGMNVPPPSHMPVGSWGEAEVRRMGVAVDNRSHNILKLTIENPHLYSEYEQYERLLEEYEKAPDKALRTPPVTPEPTYNGYVAGLAVKMPENVVKPWLFLNTTSDAPVDASIRFTVESSKVSKEKAAKAVISQEKELQHQLDSGLSQGTDQTRNRYQRARQHSAEFNTGHGTTQVEFTVRFLVHADTEIKARRNANWLATQFDDKTNTNLTAIRDSHGTFYLEAMPGSSVRSTIYKDQGTVYVLSNGMPFATRHIGHMRDGYYMGAYGQIPFLYDPALCTKQGKASTMVFNSVLGGGKTSAMMQYFDLFRLRSYRCIALDPKGDIKGHLSLIGRGHARLWSVTTQGKPGMLDPFSLLEIVIDPDDPTRDTLEKAREQWREKTSELVTDTILSYLDSNISHDQRNILLGLITEEINSENPSMYGLIKRLQNGETGETYQKEGISEAAKENARIGSLNMYTLLSSVSSGSLGKLIFGKREGRADLFLKGVNTTIIDLSGLDLPRDGKPAANNSERISVTIFSLVAAYASRAVLDRKIKGSKCLLIDEVNIVKGTPAFRGMAAQVNSMARSLSIVSMYGDQSSKSSLDGDLFSNKIGSRIIFKSSLAERTALAEDMGWTGQDAQTLIKKMPNENQEAGYAFHTTQPDKYSVYPTHQGLGEIRFDRDYNPEYVDAFETNDEQKEGFTRAAYRNHDQDNMGIVHDPESPALAMIEAVETSTDKVLYADSEAAANNAVDEQKEAPVQDSEIMFF